MVTHALLVGPSVFPITIRCDYHTHIEERTHGNKSHPTYRCIWRNRQKVVVWQPAWPTGVEDPLGPPARQSFVLYVFCFICRLLLAKEKTLPKFRSVTTRCRPVAAQSARRNSEHWLVPFTRLILTTPTAHFMYDSFKAKYGCSTVHWSG